jgi:hypothetical protein
MFTRWMELDNKELHIHNRTVECGGPVLLLAGKFMYHNTINHSYGLNKGFYSETLSLIIGMQEL